MGKAQNKSASWIKQSLQNSSWGLVVGSQHRECGVNYQMAEASGLGAETWCCNSQEPGVWDAGAGVDGAHAQSEQKWGGGWRHTRDSDRAGMFF